MFDSIHLTMVGTRPRTRSEKRTRTTRRRAFAYHEAGHAIAASALGLPLDEVFLHGDPERSRRGGEVAISIPSTIPWLVARQGETAIRRWQATMWRKAIVCCFAGIMGEMEGCKWPTPCGWRNRR